MAARSTGSATIAFGLVSVPVKTYTATSEERVSFNQLHSCGSRVQMPLHCPKCDKKVERTEVVKGYEVTAGQFVTFTTEELAALEADKTPTMEIQEFVAESSIDPLYYENAAFLGPDKGAEKAYGLLNQALIRTKTVAICQRVKLGKEQVVAIRATKTGLVMHTLRTEKEVRNQADAVGPLAQVSDREVDAACRLVAQMAGPAGEHTAFHPEKYPDTFLARLEVAIAAKQAGEQILAAPALPKAATLDLFAALTASLEQGKGKTTVTPTEAPKQVEAKPAAKAKPAKKGKEARP